jgi:hypothetical protein
MRGKISTWIKGLAIVAGSLIGASSAHAGMTSIGKMGAGEDSQQQIFAHAFGGSWHQEGTDFYDGAVSAKRMDDFLSVPSVLDIAHGDCGYSTDQTWTGNKFSVTAVAKFSGNSQVLGTVDSHGNSQSIMDVQGYGYDITPASKTVDMNGQDFKWTRDGNSGLQTSLNSDNADGRDHLITYVVNNLPGTTGPVWMLFFEDMTKTSATHKHATYADFNDLVVEVRPMVNAVPLPPAGWAGLFTLSGIALVRGRKVFTKALTA